VDQDIGVHDKRLAKIIQQCQELPGHELFQYIDASGKKQQLNSEHVNAYVKEIANEDFSAKDFRTWGGTIQAAESLLKIGESENEKVCKASLITAVKEAAEILGNRPATCRKYYIDPRIFEAYQACELCKELERFLKQKADPAPESLRPIEKGVHYILQKVKK
jgi:DNA topoisomerase-1